MNFEAKTLLAELSKQHKMIQPTLKRRFVIGGSEKTQKLIKIKKISP